MAKKKRCALGRVKSGARKGLCRKTRVATVSAKSRSHITRSYSKYKKATKSSRSTRGDKNKVWYCFPTHCGRECAATADAVATKKRKWVKAWGSAKSVGAVYTTKSHRRDGSDPSWCD